MSPINLPFLTDLPPMKPKLPPTLHRRAQTTGEVRLRSAICARDVKQARSASWVDWRPDARLRPGVTISDLLDVYLAKLEREDRASFQDVRSIVECYLRPAFGRLLVEALAQVDLMAWIEVLKGCLAANTVHCRFSPLKAALEMARRAKVITVNPCTALPRGVLPARKTRPGFDPASEVLSPVELGMVIGSVAKPEEVTYAALGLAGLRVGEFSALRCSDIDRTRDPLWSLTVERSWSRKTGRFHTTKTGVTRFVPVHPALRSILERWLNRGWAETYGRSPGPTDLLVPRLHKGGLVPLNDRRVLERWHRALKRVGLARRRLHSLRHTFVSMLLAAGSDWRAVERITHPTPRWRSLEVYAHYQWPVLCRAVSQLQLDIAGSSQLELFGR